MSKAVQNVSVGGLVCQLVTIPERVNNQERLNRWLAALKLSYCYGRMAIAGGASAEARLLVAIRLLFHCAGHLTEVLERTNEGYVTLASHDKRTSYFTLTGEPIERIA